MRHVFLNRIDFFYFYLLKLTFQIKLKNPNLLNVFSFFKCIKMDYLHEVLQGFSKHKKVSPAPYYFVRYQHNTDMLLMCYNILVSNSPKLNLFQYRVSAKYCYILMKVTLCVLLMFTRFTFNLKF